MAKYILTSYANAPHIDRAGIGTPFCLGAQFFSGARDARVSLFRSAFSVPSGMEPLSAFDQLGQDRAVVVGETRGLGVCQAAIDGFLRHQVRSSGREHWAIGLEPCGVPVAQLSLIESSALVVGIAVDAWRGRGNLGRSTSRHNCMRAAESPEPL